MTLTEEQKQHIAEEEEYRAKIREESQKTSKKRGGGCSGCLVVLIVVVVLFAITLIAINPQKQFEQAEKANLPTITPSLVNVIGKHAYNKINGTYRGEILEVKPCNTTSELICYVVNQPSFMRPIEAPADNSIVKDEAPNP